MGEVDERSVDDQLGDAFEILKGATTWDGDQCNSFAMSLFELGCHEGATRMFRYIAHRNVDSCVEVPLSAAVVNELCKEHAP